MSNKRYTYSDSSSLLLPQCNLLYIALSKDDSDWSSVPHSHYFTEIFYITEGKGIFEADGKRTAVTSGDLLVVMPHILHTEYSSGNSPMEYIVLGVEGISFPSGELSFFHLKNNPSRNHYYLLLRRLLSEMEEEKPYQEEFCKNLLNLLLLQITRETDTLFSPSEGEEVSSECATVKRHIDTYYREEIRLENLAKLVHWNKYHLAHVFTETYGIPPIKYLLNKRIEESKYLLQSTNSSLSSIARQTGFSSLSYFSQSFRRITDTTPMEYRKAKTR